jgi:hypothetical protein
MINFYVRVPNVSREIYTKNDVIEGVGRLDQNDMIWGQVNSSGVPPDQKDKQSKVTNFHAIGF